MVDILCTHCQHIWSQEDGLAIPLSLKTWLCPRQQQTVTQDFGHAGLSLLPTKEGFYLTPHSVRWLALDPMDD